MCISLNVELTKKNLVTCSPICPYTLDSRQVIEKQRGKVVKYKSNPISNNKYNIMINIFCIAKKISKSSVSTNSSNDK